MNTEDEALLELKQLESKIDSLILLCQKLKAENRALKIKQAELIRERSQLEEKTSVAKSRVETMIARLKSMGHDT